MRTSNCSNRPYLSRLGSSARLSLVGTRTMYNWIPSSKASVLQKQSTTGPGLHAAALLMTCHQTECTTAVWSKERARPFLIPCSATVLSLWTTTLCPLRSFAKVERPRLQKHPSTSTRSTRAALALTICNREHLQRCYLVVSPYPKLTEDCLSWRTVRVPKFAVLRQNCRHSGWCRPGMPQQTN